MTIHRKIADIVPKLCNLMEQPFNIANKEIQETLESEADDEYINNIPLYDYTEFNQDMDIYFEIGVAICLDDEGNLYVGKKPKIAYSGNVDIDLTKKSCNHLITATFHTHPIFGNYPSGYDVEEPKEIDFICIGGNVINNLNIKCYSPKKGIDWNETKKNIDLKYKTPISKGVDAIRNNVEDTFKPEAVFRVWNWWDDPDENKVDDIGIYTLKNQKKIDKLITKRLKKFYDIKIFDCKK